VKGLNKHIVIIAGFFIFVSIFRSAGNDFKEDYSKTGEIQNTELSAWIVDWQWESGIEDLKRMEKKLLNVQVFAAYFDSTNKLYFTDDAIDVLHHLGEISKNVSSGDVILTLVNDRFNEDGSVTQKDPTIVTKLMETIDSRRSHIRDILDIVDRYGFAGIEIDYENINVNDWRRLRDFYSELYEQLKDRGKSLRIVLEPRAPIKDLMLPEGPTYVMMAYNLYGSHSGPGPKADYSFIAKLASDIAQVPGDNYIALSVGGFDWQETGKVYSVTEKQAEALAKESNVVPIRDENSGSLHFEYRDKYNVKHTVWYADAVTLSQWIATARQAGISKIALWKLGGLSEETLKVW